MYRREFVEQNLIKIKVAIQRDIRFEIKNTGVIGYFLEFSYE